MARPSKPFAERFWSRVDKAATCWLWRGWRDPDGYGQIALPSGRRVRAHAASWLIAHGELPPATRYVLHRCDVPACVNPAHLFLGTQRDNMQDMVAKGRKFVRRGADNTQSKLTADAVRGIRAAYAAKLATMKKLADRYQVSPSVVSEAIARKTWKHVA